MDDGHPCLATHFVRSGFAIDIADAGAFKAIPYDAGFAPFNEPLHSSPHIPEFARYFRIPVHRRVNIEGSNIAAFDIFRVILRVVASHPSSDVVIPCDTLAQV